MSSSALAAGLRHLRSKLAAHERREDSDEQLLYTFTSRRDDSAFAALVRRHGPMVLHVCRRVLGHEQDAEDAFQATFLVLTQNAATLRNKSMLASFLHGVAYRTAMKVKQSAARRRKHESRAPARPPTDPADELSWREVRRMLDEEIDCLPEIYRIVFVLFHLEHLSREETARRLGLKDITVAKRLGEARKRLAQRLARRGVELTAVVAAATVATPTASAVPAGLMASTIQAALATAAGEALSGLVPASVAELVRGATASVVLSQAKMAAVLLLTVALATGAGAWICRTVAMPQPAEKSQSPEQVAPQLAAAENRQAQQKEKTKGVAIGGRVLDPDGKPVSGARLHLPGLKKEQLRPLATSDAAGRFRFHVMPADVGLAPWLNKPWRYVYIMVFAEGYGPGIAAVGDPAEADKLTLRLAKDDVHIKGRVLDLQGKPVAGVTVRVNGIGVPNKGDLTEFLNDLKGRIDAFPAVNNFLTTMDHEDFFAHLCPPVTTDADGRFRITGIGRERVADLTISGPTIETRKVTVRTRPGEMIHKLAWAHDPNGERFIYYGAEFEHAAAPTKPIVGVVRDKSTGKPLAKATIRSLHLAGRNYTGQNLIHTVADKDGHYRLVGMPMGGGNMIVAESPAGLPFAGLIRSVELTRDINPATVDFELRRGVLVKGRVTDKKTGAAMAAQINYFLFDDNPLRDQIREMFIYRYLGTEADGSFQMVVPPGHGLLAVRVLNGLYLSGVGAEKIEKVKGDPRFLATAPICNFMAHNRLLEINPAKGAETLECHLDVDPGRTLAGTIVDPDGKPLAGAQICGLRSGIIDWEDQPLRTAEFTVNALASGQPRRLLAIHRGERLAGSLEVRGDEKGPVTIKLQPWGVLAGRLVTAAGDTYTKGTLSFGLGTHPHTTIPRDKMGRFRVEGLVPGLKYRLMLLSSGNVGEEIIVEAGETKDLGELRVE